MGARTRIMSRANEGVNGGARAGAGGGARARAGVNADATLLIE
jgi:hypothetical protein